MLVDWGGSCARSRIGCVDGRHSEKLTRKSALFVRVFQINRYRIQYFLTALTKPAKNVFRWFCSVQHFAGDSMAQRMIRQLIRPVKNSMNVLQEAVSTWITVDSPNHSTRHNLLRSVLCDPEAPQRPFTLALALLGSKGQLFLPLAGDARNARDAGGCRCARNARDAGGRRGARSARGRWSAGRSGHACSGWEIRPTFGAYSIERGVIEATIRALQIRAGIGWSKTHFFLLSFASLLEDCLQNTFVLYSPSPHRTIGRSC